MSQTVTLADAEGPLGTVTLDGGVLSGSTRPLQRVADRELARTGSAGAAFAALQALSNGYVWALRPGPEPDSLAPVLRETETANNLAGQLTDLAAWEHERRGPDGRWVRGISTQILDPFYNELPESGLRGTVRSKGTFGGQGGRDLEDAARIRAYRREHPVQPNPITAAEARGNSRPVSMDEYQALAAQGLNRLGQLSQKTGHGGLTRHWDEIKAKTYPKVLEPWGGATIDSKTGVPLEDGVDAYAITVKPAGMEHVSIPEGASEAQFNAAMDQALARFGAELDRQQRYLGVFHDDENHRIDIDPVLVVSTLAEVEQIGSYTRAVGGAYRFSDGNGYWPPHVAEGAALAADGGTVHFEGPGQWRSQAAEAQDGLSPEQQAEIDAADDGLDED